MRMECAVCRRRKRSSFGNLCVRMLADLLYANHNVRSDSGSLSLDNLPSVPTHKMGTGG